MNKLIIFLLCSLLVFSFFQCKNDKPTTVAAVPKSLPTINKSDTAVNKLLVQLPPEYYHPAGMRQLDVMEMYKFGTGNATAVRSLPLKDKNGNPVTYHIMENPEKPMFMQMYANDSNRVVEGVVFEMNEELKGLIMKARLAAQ